jgi:hypothetical protein
MGEAPRAGDLMIRPTGTVTFGVFRLGTDMFEHPFRSFDDYIHALDHAVHVGKQSHVDVWEARSYYVTSILVRGFRISPV